MGDNKAFLFDMDGVLADSENEWERLGYDMLLKEHFGIPHFNDLFGNFNK